MTPPTNPKEALPICETCDGYEVRDNVVMGEWVSVPVCCGKIITDSEITTVKKKGCLFHPSAREYLNRDVIGELERRQKETGSFETSRVYGNAVKLLKEGVKK